MRSLIPFFSAMIAISILAPFSASGEEMEVGLDTCSSCGWFWYETKQVDENEIKEPPAIIPSTDILLKMPPDEFQLILDNTRKEAVRVPTVDNVKNYFLVQDIARRKAAAFANVAAVVSKMYPELSGGRDMPISAPGRKVVQKTRRDEIESTIKGARNEFALLYFHSQDCGFCEAQNGILMSFLEKYHWAIKTLDINHDPAVASRFNVHTTPTLLLIYKQSQDYLPVAVGVVSLSELVKGLFAGIRLLRGAITPQQSSIYDFQRGGYYDPAAYKKETNR